MEPQEIAENAEKAKESGERVIGLSMAILAVLLAIATMLSHRSHTEEVLLETQATDQWNYYQAKNIRSHVYDADSELAGLLGGKADQVILDFKSKSAQQKKDSEDIQKEAERLQAEVELAGKRASYYDISELFLEVGIVLCSISLLSRRREYWKGSFVVGFVGIAAALWGLFGLH